MAAEIGRDARATVGLFAASMGPQLIGCGDKVRQCSFAIVGDGFNGAAADWLRR